MVDYGRRLLVVVIIAVCIGLMFMGGTTKKAAGLHELPDEWIWPVAGTLSDTFGSRGGEHKGIDIAASSNTDIHAVSNGVVSKSYYSESYGHVVFIFHEQEGFETVYAHLNKRLVNEGEVVARGQLIGKMGNTGNSRGTHLHFEVHEQRWSYAKENAINPLMVLHKQNNGIAYNDSIETASLNNNEHVVKKGETLWSISEQYDIPISQLKESNQLHSDTIYIDQKLMIHQEKR